MESNYGTPIVVWLPDDQEDLVAYARILPGSRITVQIGTVWPGETNIREHESQYEITYNHRLRKVVNQPGKNQ